MTMVLATLGVLALIAVAFGAYIRLAADDPRVWHIDPATAQRTGKPNDFVVAPEGGDMVSPVWDMTPEALMVRFREVAMAAPRTTVLGERDGFATFVQRSRLWRFPDYISVRAVPAKGGGSQLIVYSRARYGYGDGGVNKARILGWLKRL